MSSKPVHDLHDLQVVLDQIGAYIFTKDREGRYTFVNQMVCELFGFPREYIIGCTDEKFFDLTISDQLRINDRRVLEHGERLEREETNIIAASGERRIFWTVKAPLRNTQGEIKGMCGISTDITEKTQLQEEFREKRELLDLVMTHVDAHIYLKDRDGRYRYVNPPVAAMYQQTPEYIIGKTDYELLSKQQADRFRKLDLTVFNTGTKVQQIETYTDELGNTRYFLSVKLLIKHEHQQECLIGFSTDITERKQMEDQLAMNEAKLRLILESTQECVKLVSRDGTLISMNRAGLSLVDAKTPEQVINRCVYDLIAPEYRENFRLFNERVCDGEAGTLQFEIISLKRNRYWMETRAVPFSPPDGGATVQLAFTEEITQRKHNENALRDSEMRMRTLFEATSDAVMLLNERGFFDCNPATLSIFGCCSKAEFISKHPADLSPETQPCGTASTTLANQFIVKAMQEGSHKFDWIHTRLDTQQHFHAEVLLNAMTINEQTVLQAVVRDITERVLLQRELEKQAHIDYLTGVNNRRHFMHLFDVELARTKRYDNALSLLMLDVDYFKRINDTHGHKAGDRVLQKLADVCQKTLRDCDIVGRFGGEEFTLLLPETPSQEASEAAERLRLAIETTKVSIPDGLPIRFTASIGVTSLKSMDDNIEVLIDQADQALYAAKNTGRNKVSVYRHGEHQ